MTITAIITTICMIGFCFFLVKACLFLERVSQYTLKRNNNIDKVELSVDVTTDLNNEKIQEQELKLYSIFKKHNNK